MSYMKDANGRRLDSIAVPAAAEVAPHGGNVMVATGDSITEVNSSRSNNSWGDSWATYATLASGGRLQHNYAAALGGATTATTTGIVQTEVFNTGLPHNLLVIADGTNDSDPLAQTLVHNETLIQAELARGGRVALCTIPPSGMQALGVVPVVTATALPGRSGGTLAAGTYRYIVYARGQFGDSLPSTEVSATLSATGAVLLSWPPVPGAIGYAVAGRGATGKGNLFLNGANTGESPGTNHFVDLGTATPGDTHVPTSDTTAGPAVDSAVRSKIARVNLVKQRLAAKYGLPLIDQHALLADWSVEGRFKRGYTTDGTHPTGIVQRLMGVNVAATLEPWLPPNGPNLIHDPFDPTSIFAPRLGGNFYGHTQGLLLPDGPGDVMPGGWGAYGDSATATSSVTTDPTVSGYVYTVNRTDWTGYYPATGTTSGYKAGDRIQFAFKIKTSGLDACDAGSVAVGIHADGSSTSANVSAIIIRADAPVTAAPGGWATWHSEGVIPPGTTNLTVGLYVVGAGVSASIAQLTIRNLTALGL